MTKDQVQDMQHPVYTVPQIPVYHPQAVYYPQPMAGQFVPPMAGQYPYPMEAQVQGGLLPPVQQPGQTFSAPRPMTRSWVEKIPYESNLSLNINQLLEKYIDYQPVQITDYVPYERTFQDYAEVQHNIEYQPVTRLQKRVNYMPVEQVDQYIDYYPIQTSNVNRPMDQNVPVIPRPPTQVQPQQVPYQSNAEMHKTVYPQQQFAQPLADTQRPYLQAPFPAQYPMPYVPVQQVPVPLQPQVPGVAFNPLYNNPYWSPYGSHLYRY